MSLIYIMLIVWKIQKRIAPQYGIDFQPTSYPKKELVDFSNAILTSVGEDKFSEVAQKVSNALWQGDEDTLISLSKVYVSSEKEVSEKLASGNSIRNAKGYFGSAFYYEKELYWGVDRIDHLEDRLTELGLKKT